MNLKFWDKENKREGQVLCSICGHDITKAVICYQGENSYCEFCFKRQKFLGDDLA